MNCLPSVALAKEGAGPKRTGRGFESYYIRKSAKHFISAMITTHVDGNHGSLAMAMRQLDLHYKKIWDKYRKLEPQNFLTSSQERMLEIAQASEQLEAASFMFCIVTASFVEAVANLYLALKCDVDAARFATLEPKSLEDKWKTLPRQFNPEYKLDLGLSPGSDLVKLIEIRNKLAHTKPFIKVNESVLHAGTKVAITSEYLAFILRLGSLPKLLVQNLEQYDSSDAMNLLINMSGIERDWYIQKLTERAKKTAL